MSFLQRAEKKYTFTVDTIKNQIAMKQIKIAVLAVAAIGFAACCDNTPRQMMGFIADASMNTVIVKGLTSDSTYVFSTEQADMADANGLLIGAPVIVDYKGCLEKGTLATKVSTDATYCNAVGKWVMPDPINPESVMGIELMVEGEAQSINMATLRYNNWELQGEAGKIILNGVSEGSGEPIDFSETAVLTKNADGVWTLAVSDTGVVLSKVVE